MEGIEEKIKVKCYEYEKSIDGKTVKSNALEAKLVDIRKEFDDLNQENENLEKKHTEFIQYNNRIFEDFRNELNVLNTKIGNWKK